MKKILKFGKASFAIILPKKWVDYNSLKKGDEVHHLIDKAELIISPNKIIPKINEKEIIIDNSITPKAVDLMVGGVYDSGYSQLTMTSKDGFKEGQVRAVENKLKRCPGFEVIDQTDKRIVIKDLLNLELLDVITCLRKQKLNTRKYFYFLCSPKDEELIRDRYVEVSNSAHLCRKSILSKNKDVFQLLSVSFWIWDALLIAKTMLEKGIALEESVVVEINSFLDKLFNQFVNKQNDVNFALSEVKRITSLVDNEVTKVHVNYLLNSLGRVSEYYLTE